jgi:hypothetical protein
MATMFARARPIAKGFFSLRHPELAEGSVPLALKFHLGTPFHFAPIRFLRATRARATQARLS